MHTNENEIGDKFSNISCIKTEEIEIKSEETFDEETYVEIVCGDIKKENEQQYTPPHSVNAIIDAASRNAYSPDVPKLRRSSAESPEAVFQCDTCPFKSKYKSCLLNHRWTHSDSRKYICDKCTYKTNYITRLKNHQLEHENPSDVPTYPCDKCEYETHNKEHFKNHLLVHMDPSEVNMFACEWCEYKSKYRNSLKVHRLTHMDPSEVTMYRCDKCDYKTKYKTGVALHQRTHRDPSEVRHDENESGFRKWCRQYRFLQRKARAEALMKNK